MSTVSGNTIGNGKWYIVDKKITRNSRLRITGECNLILSSHGKLECSKGISVNRGNTLNIYSDYYDDSGWLYCELSSEDGDAAIGGDEEKNGGTINIHGGSIYAEAKCYGAGIGGGHSGSGADVVIMGGEVIANAGCPSACAIGGGKGKQGGSLRLYDKACVMVTSDTSDVNSLTRVLSEQRIPSTRTYPLVHILPCIHPDGYSYSNNFIIRTLKPDSVSNPFGFYEIYDFDFQ